MKTTTTHRTVSNSKKDDTRQASLWTRLFQGFSTEMTWWGPPNTSWQMHD